MLSVLAEEEGAVFGSRRCVLLAGVHSGGQGGGADALSRILVHLGVYQAGDAGDFADRLQSLNRDILESAGFDECSIEPLHAGWYSSLRYAEFHKRAVELVRSAFASSLLFVLEDTVAGAAGRLVPFWRDVMMACDVDPVVLDFYEDPASFAKGFAQSFGISGEAARTVWLARVIESEQASRGLVRAQVTQQALLDDWEDALARLSQALGVAWPAWSSRVRRAIVGELVHCKESVAEAAQSKTSQANRLGRWEQTAQDVLWRWARDGEDDRGLTQMDELRALFGEAREPLGLAFSALSEMGQELGSQKQIADDLLAKIAELERAPNAAQAELDVERDRHAGLSQADGNEQDKAEAKWLKVFRSRLQAVDVLAEQNGVFQAAIERLKAEVDELKMRLAEANSRVKRLRIIEIAQKADLTSAGSELSRRQKLHDSLNKSLAEARSRVTQLSAEASSREATIEELQDALLTRAEVAGGAEGIVDKSRTVSLSPKSLLLYLKPKARRKMLRHQHLRILVLTSGLFDAQFYAARYPDVVAAGFDLIDHFITYGGAEGRHPSQWFNSRWYLNEYPDIAARGVNPLVHYVEHGRAEGRRRRSLTDAGALLAELSEASAAPTSEPRAPLAQAVAPPPEVRAEASEMEGSWRPRVGGWKAILSLQVDHRSAIVPLEELSRQADARVIALHGKTVALCASNTPQMALSRVALFAAMRSAATGPMTVAGERVTDIAPYILLAQSECGFGLLADGWFDSETRLTLRMASGVSGVVRAFQADGEGRLHCVAEAVLGGGEAECVDVRIVDTLAPLLVVLANRDGALVDSAVVPFPSLLRGGLHYGELAVLETAPGSMATLAEYSQMLVLEWLGWEGGPETFAIGWIEIDMRGASGAEPIFRPALLSSIARNFGITVRAQKGSYAPQRGQLVTMLDAAGLASTGRDDTTSSLVIPSDGIPSIYGLVARRMPHDHSLSRFAVVDGATGRPHADVALPFDEGLAGFQHAEMPAHAPYVRSSGEQHVGSGGPVFPLAVRHYNRLAWQADPLLPVSPDCQMPMEMVVEKAITVVIDAGQDCLGLANCLAALENQIGAEQLDVILAGWPDAVPLPACELQVRSIDCQGLTLAGRLNAAAQMSQAPRLLFLAPWVHLSDPRTAATLSRLADRSGTASVACALVTELHDDGEAKVHSAGYFPTRVSLHGEPVFDFDQLDIARAMPAATFPVVANHAKCVLYDAETFGSLGGFDAQRFPMAMYDLDLGFRALAAGHANLCTTLVRAAVDEAASSADFPDPLAHRSVRPAEWQSLLDRVTVIRELRR